MSTETLSPALPFEGRESLLGSILISAGMHAVLLGVMLGYGLIRFGRGEAWGNPWEKGSSARVKAVSSLPGVPLPAPMQVTPNTLANDSPGLYKSEPIPPLPLENAEPIPAPTDCQQLAQENRTLRGMITELLIKNQNLRWELLAHEGLREETT